MGHEEPNRSHAAKVDTTDRGWRLGVDVGGTFTDVALVNSENGRLLVYKSPTNQHDLAASVTRAVGEVLEKTGIPPNQLASVSTGSTIGLNTIIERSSGPTGLLVTRGFGDVLEIRRTRLLDAPSFNAARPVALVPRRLVKEIDERIDASGQVLRSLQEDQLLSEAEELLESGIQSLAISFLHSYANSSHESRAAELVSARWPNLTVCTSFDTWPQQREYERTLCTVMNAYIGPRMQSYYTLIARRLAGLGIRCPMFVTQSNGGLLSMSEAANIPIRTLLSGPAAGVVGATRASGEAGLAKIFTFDMGGTSADMAVVDERPRLSTDSGVGEYTLFMPAVGIDSIGAGGGSIAWIDAQGTLKVGPRSAGAVPGPACYGRGGSEPTVTDAYFVAGIIGERDLLGGTMQASTSLARRALTELGDRIDLSAADVAEAILAVTTANMSAELLPLVARHGIDKRDFCLVAYGGAGPTHAFMLAEEASIDRILIPRVPGAMCAAGAAQTDLQMDFVRSGRWTLANELAAVDETFAELEGQALAWVENQGVSRASARVTRSADMRYEGQSYELTVELSPQRAPSEAFDSLYEQVYGYRDRKRAVDVLQARVEVSIPTPAPSAPKAALATPPDPPQPKDRRSVRYRELWIDVPVYSRDQLSVGNRLAGPLIVTQYDTTTFVVPGFHLSVDRWGNLRGERSHE